MMVIYKFGGASVKNENAFHLLKSIVSNCDEELIVVVSVMGKTTNKLEEVVKLASTGSGDFRKPLTLLKAYHQGIADKLVPGYSDSIHDEIDAFFVQITERIEKFRAHDFNFFYDQVVSMGEIISTYIVSRFLANEGISNQWVDIRDVLKTDDNFRDATIDFEESKINFMQAFTFRDCSCYVTQGFIGSAKNGNFTTLGREGSDYTAAILAHILFARSVTLWKDVAGIFNADPAVFSKVTLLEKITYQEMIELAYYGAKVIHPKTIKPLRTKQIPLFVKCFYDPEKPGSQIGEFPDIQRTIPIIIIKDDQILISISLTDLSFISEYHISKLFALLNKFRLKANLMQHSAVSFSVCVDEPRGREVDELIGILRTEFKILYNKKLTLITIRHYTEDSIAEHISGKKIFVEQRSRNTVQYLIV